jgi:uncharacterized protein with von Willebrand factor type A (vWA) domain
MDDRIVQFIAGLRGAGVRISIAESEDALLAAQLVDATNRQGFETALRTTLIKEHHDEATFARLFPMFFGVGAPPLLPASAHLSPDQFELLRDALQSLGLMDEDWLQLLLSGESPQAMQLESALQRAGLAGARAWRDLQWLLRQTTREMGLARLMHHIEALLDQLAQAGIADDLLRDMRTLLHANAEALLEQVSRFVGAGLAQRLSEIGLQEPQEADLLDVPFRELSQHETRQLRVLVERLAAKLRTRAALRQKRGKGRAFDAKATLRANVRYGGVPFDVIRKRRRRKPKITILCDISTSMRPVVYFLLLLVYQVQDQIGRTRSFAYIDRIMEISDDFSEHRPEVAVSEVLDRIHPGHYNTDFGRSLEQFTSEHLDAVDERTTLIICGDGRNNFNPSRSDLLQMLTRRARTMVWFNPEPPTHWGSGDSDMQEYIPVIDRVFQVSNLRQLGEALDRLLV